MNEFRKDFQPMQGRFLDRAGKAARDENTYWTPIVVTKKEIDAEVERLASLPQPANGRRESLIVHPLAAADAPGFAPGIQVKLSVLKPGEKTAAFRHNATEVNFCIGGSGHTLVAGRRVAFAQYDVWNHPSYAIYRHVNDGRDLQVRLTYSNVPLLQHMQIYLPEDEPSAELRPVDDAEEKAASRDPRRKSPYGMIRIGAEGGMLMPYEILINPQTVESKPLHFPWKEVKRELDKLEALGKDYVGRRLYMMYNPVTGRTRYSMVAGNRYEWKAGDLMLSAPGWAVHNHASYDDYVYELTVQDQPLNIYMESLLWQEDLNKPAALLGSQPGFETNRNKAAA